MGKKRLDLMIDEDLYMVLRDYVSYVLGRRKGGLTEVVKEALKLFFVATGFSEYEGNVQEYIRERLGDYMFKRKEPHLYRPEPKE